MTDADEQAIGSGWLTAARAWTGSVREAVMQPWRIARQQPDPTMVLNANGVWVQQLTRHVRPPILDTLRGAYARAFGRQPPPGFDRDTYVDQYLDTAVNRMTGTPDEVYRRITSSLADGIREGDTPAQLAARVDEILTVTGNDWWDNRAVVVARTEAGGAVNAGTLAAGGHEQAVTGRPHVKEWIATVGSPTTRPAHLAADGQVQPLTAPFDVGGEPLQYPGDPSGSAGNVIQCFPGNTVVSSASPARKLFRRWYEGPMVCIETLDGVKLSATPNHPLLVGPGWKAAQLVQVGDDLWGRFGGEGGRIGNPQVENGPATFDEIYRSSAEAAQPARVVGGVMDFHGDGANGYVEVVPLDSDLRAVADAGAIEDRDHGVLVGVGGTLGFLPRDRHGECHPVATLSDLPLSGVPLGAGGLVSGSRERGSLVEGHGGHADSVRLGSVPDVQSECLEAADNERTADSESLRDRENRLALGMSGSQVVRVDVLPFQGFVFNLETDGGWYTANGIVSHNCRCTLSVYER